MPHQLEEYRGEVHCSELFVNSTHQHLGSLRNRYCNWQFLEYLKDKHCYSAVNEIWTEGVDNDPFSQIMNNMGWSIGELNDFLGEWAMHNITWDYKDPPPTATAGEDHGSVFRSSYGLITDTSRAERRQRITRLEALDDDWGTNRRFVVNYYAAPQRWGYNVVRLYPESGASSVQVTFRGVTQSGADSVYVGPYAQVLGGNVSGDARIEDHAIILGGTVSGGTVGGLTVMSNFTVSGSAEVRATFLPIDFFEGSSATGSVVLYGDLEYRANKSSGAYTGFVDGSTASLGSINDVTTPPPYSWRD
jgi:hypothetical protein